MAESSELNEIVGRIVDEICAAAQPGPAVDPYGELSTPAVWLPGPEPISDRENIEASVRAVIRLLRVLAAPLLRRNRRQIAEDDLPALLKQIEGLQKTLRRISRPALFMLLSGEDDVSANKIPSTETQGKVQRRAKQLTATLEYLRVRCHFLLEEQPGEHGSADYRKRHVAHEAWRLLKRNGLEPAGGAQGSLYGNVTTMLWEATTGEVEKDLRAACKAALRAAQAGELRTDGPVMGRGQFPLS